MSSMYCSAKMLRITPTCNCPCHCLTGWFGIVPPCDGTCCQFQLVPIAETPAPVPAKKFVEEISLALKVGALEAERDRLLKENRDLKVKLERVREAAK